MCSEERGKVNLRIDEGEFLEEVALYLIRSDQIISVAQSCPTLCDPMNRSLN